jgi:hypothetical protein
LKYAYVITCDSVVRNEQGEVIEVVCTYDDQTRAGATPEGSKKVSSRSDCSFDSIGSDSLRFDSVPHRVLLRPDLSCCSHRPHLLHRIPNPALLHSISILRIRFISDMQLGLSALLSHFSPTAITLTLHIFASLSTHFPHWHSGQGHHPVGLSGTRCEGGASPIRQVSTMSVMFCVRVVVLHFAPT